MNKENIKPDLYQKAFDEKSLFEVNIPSEGKLYPTDNPLSEGKLNIMEMTGKHENILLSQKYVRQGTQYDELLRQLVVEKYKGFEPEDLILEDKLYLILAVRIYNFGSEIKIKSLFCPHCYTNEEDITVDLGDIKDQERKILPDSEYSNEFTTELPKSKNKVTLGVLTSKDEKIIEEQIQKNRKHTSEEVGVSMAFAQSIKKIDGEAKSFGENKDFYEDLPILDVKHLQKFLREATGNVSLLIDRKCSNCGEISEQKLQFDEEFFFPDI